MSNEAASNASTYQFKSPEQEGAGEKGRERERFRREEENANLGRSSEAPVNIGHWPIFSLRRKEDLL